MSLTGDSGCESTTGSSSLFESDGSMGSVKVWGIAKCFCRYVRFEVPTVERARKRYRRGSRPLRAHT